MSTANRDSESPQNSPAPKTARGVMNCRPCQIRKIKCDRALPACGVCHLYQRSCFYEGVPKKRGPKKESLSALIKRIDGLEELLKSDKTPTPPGTDIINTDFAEPHVFGGGISEPCGSASSDISPFSNFRGNNFEASSDVSATINADGLVDVYFTKFHRNPYDILDEFTTRQRLKANQLSRSVLYAICAVATGFSERSGKGPSSHVSGETYAAWAQREIDPCEVSLDSCQALLLLVAAFAAMGDGKRAYVVLSQAVGMAMTLELYSQPSDGVHDDTTKRVFWTCYIMNTFVSTWLERPSLMDDSLIKADIQSSRQPSHSGWGTSNDFVAIPNNDFRRFSASPKEPIDEIQKLVWMAQILSEANRYLLLSDTASQAAYCQRHKILHDLDVWASSIGSSTDLPTESQGGPGMNLPFISRLVVHLIHCLIHRPILPLRLNEPSGVKMIQHWVVEATETAFRHATAILELVGQARETSNMPLPPFVGFCIFTAATVLNYGIHYASEQIPEALAVNVAPFAGSPIPASFFASSRDLYSRSLDELSILSDTFTSARLYLLRLEELKSEHAALLNGKVAGYVPSFSNRFFQRYSPAFLRRVQGFQTGDSTTIHSKMRLSQSPSSATHEERFPREPNPSVAWNVPPPTHTSRPSFTVPRTNNVGIPNTHNPGHHRSFSDSLSMSQSYSFDSNGSLSHKQLPLWSGFQDATPRRGDPRSPTILGPPEQLTSPICQPEGVVGGGSDHWGNMKSFPGGEQIPYQVLGGSVAAAGPAYQPQEALGSSFVPFQNFSVP